MWRSLVVGVGLLLVLPASALADAGDIIVQRAPGLDASERLELRRDAGVKLVETLPLERTELVRAADPRRALEKLRADADVVFAEADQPVSSFHVFADPEFGELWGLRNVGQPIDGFGFGVAGADIRATTAWDSTLGAGVTVAVVDSGIYRAHPDLRDQLAYNEAELYGLPWRDDDGNGKVDDVAGWDFVDNDGDPQDLYGHGTHVAGTIAAEANNATGVVGVAPLAKLLPLRALNSEGEGWTSDIAAAFAYAGDQGVRIVNASLGGPYSAAVEAAIKAHPNTLYVVAAGNAGRDAGTVFPCALPEPNVICVGATDNRDAIASFSNTSATVVDLFAPGVGILSTYPGWLPTYAYADGTSMATPFVSGAAALALSVNPRASTRFLRYALLASVDQRPGLAGRSVTGGRLNADAAVDAILGPEPPPDPEPTPTPTPTPVPPVVTPVPTPTAEPIPPREPDVVTPPEVKPPAAALSNVKVKGSTLRSAASELRVTFRLNKAATVRFSVTAKGKKATLARWSHKARKGANSVTIRRKLPTRRTLRRGNYTLHVQVGNAEPRTLSFRVR